jgi:hypothetical protein
MSHRSLFRGALAAGAAFLLAGSALAQEQSRFTFDVKGGFNPAPGASGREVKTGWNAGFGAGMNFNSHLGAMFNFDFDSNGIQQDTLNNLGFPDGVVHLTNFTIDPVVHVATYGNADFYLTAGGGLGHFHQQFTQPTVTTVTGFNPFFGFFTAGVPTDQVLSEYTVTKPEFDVGGGVSFGTKYHGKIFGEARWRRVLFRDANYDVIPVSFGFRW